MRVTELFFRMSRAVPDLAEITSDNFEEHLTSDLTFSEFFNDFLMLPVFGAAVRYDGMSGGFELLDQTAAHLSCHIRSFLHELQSKSLSEPHWIPAEPLPDNRYIVTCLDRDECIQWLKRDRLPFFLQSDSYFEYRLAQCVCQLSSSQTSQDHVTADESRGSQAYPEPVKTSGVCGARETFMCFKRSLSGGQGDVILSLWMDIERLKTLDTHTKSRYLVWMRSQYLASVNVELLSRLGLKCSIRWQEDKLCDVQPRLLEILMLYWGQRFTHCLSDDWCVSELTLSCVCVNVSRSYLPAHVTAHICTDNRVESSQMFLFMDVLRTESRSGSVFTHFCQNSGNQLWENAVHFCSELSQYIHLFCMNTFDPYRVQHTAQMLYGVYVCSGAQRCVVLSEENRRTVLSRLTPAFEDLFDQVEELALNVLLEPWTLFSDQTTQSLKRVTQRQEVRYAETELFNRLQHLYTHTQRNLTQVFRSPPAPAEVTRAPDLWSSVPDRFRGISLDSLTRNPSQLQHFLSFLEKNSVSVYLQFCLDVEQLKKTPVSDEGLMKERHTNITTKYCNYNFLCGPNSPASKDQQMRVAAGVVCVSLLSELQSAVQKRLEVDWLPLFLSSSEFITGHKPQAAGVACEQQPVVRHLRRRQFYKQVNGGGVMASCQVSVSMRKALLNPVTCLQFQKFLCVCGDLRENDLLFWLEVQRYKDLCHSRCDDVMIQRKISIIISRFITSTTPPALQIHIPPELAQHIMSSRRALGPYVFREAQVCVFKQLLTHWPDFSAFHTAVGEDSVLRVMEHKWWRERHRRVRGEQDDKPSEDDETHTVSDEDLQENSDMTSYKISWCYSKHMAALEHEKTLSEEVTSSCGKVKFTISSFDVMFCVQTAVQLPV
ncbi:regulator of G-protein signaling 22 isoform X2 [Triplophysa dalaica]|uniref:regulator of G-protein signaling 22 isoform X2 n=1 Tax=Triplophysa dalaica TaxID=1582913 RepID=UPI0024DFB32F|nr:regulator of G-protein signaling 22 isoform X2 [Triplophysa dalaica]